MDNELRIPDAKQAKRTKFDVDIETGNGMPLIVFQGIEAQTKKQAINSAMRSLVFTAERCK